jgi:hypothetical protein
MKNPFKKPLPCYVKYYEVEVFDPADHETESIVVIYPTYKWIPTYERFLCFWKRFKGWKIVDKVVPNEKAEAQAIEVAETEWKRRKLQTTVRRVEEYESGFKKKKVWEGLA